MCEFNMAVHVRGGQSGATNLAAPSIGLTGDLGDEWGTSKKGKWVVVSSIRLRPNRSATPLPHHPQDLWSGMGRVEGAGAPIEIKRIGISRRLNSATASWPT